MSTVEPAELAQIRSELAAEDPALVEAWVGELYDELRGLAGHYLRGERADHTLQPTALVHEAYARLAKERADRWENRTHFFRAAARTMRRILVNHALHHRAQKRGGDRDRLALNEVSAVLATTEVDLVDLDDALRTLAENDPRKARVVELRCFGGCSLEDTAEALGVSTRTVEREWRFARAWLQAALSEEPD